MALAAPLIADRSELRERRRPRPRRTSPRRAATFLLGTDHIGRDVLAQLVWGARVSLYIGLLATVVAVVIGSLVGLVAGYQRRAGRSRAAADRRLLPRDPVPAAGHRARGDPRSRPDHARVVIGITSWAGSARDRPRPGPDAEPARLRRSGPRARRGEPCTSSSRHVLPGVAPLIIANATLIVPGGDPDRVDARVPRLRRPQLAVVGPAARRGAATAARSPQNAWWYYLPPGVVHHRRGARLHVARAIARADLQPAAGGSDERRARTAAAGARPVRHVPVVGRAGAGGARCQLRHRGRRDAGLAGESGCGKSTMAMALLRLVPPGTTVDGQVLARRRGCVDDEARPAAGGALEPRPSIVFQGAQHVAEPGAQGRRARSTRRSSSTTGSAVGKQRVGELLEQVGLHVAPGRRLPARAVRRAEAAGDDRDGAGVRPAAADRRRADHGARRDGAGAGAAPARATSSATAGSRWCSSPTTCRCWSSSPTGWRSCTPAGSSRRARRNELLRGSTHPYTQGARRRASRRSATRLSRSGPVGLDGDPPDPAALPTRLPVPSRAARSRSTECATDDIELLPVAPTAVPIVGPRASSVVEDDGVSDDRQLLTSTASTSRIRRAGANGLRRRGPSTASTSSSTPGEIVALVGESRLRQDHARPGVLGLRAAGAARSASRARRSPARRPAARLPPPGAAGVPGPDAAASTRARRSTRSSPRGCASTASRDDEPQRVADALARLRPAPARAVLPALPARALGRPAPARRDRRGDGARTAAARRRRAGVEPRRRRCAARSSASCSGWRARPRWRSSWSPTTWAGVEHRRPRRGDVPRPHRRDRPDRGGARRPRSTRTRGRCCRWCPRTSGWSQQILTRRAARPDQDPRRLPLPPALPARRSRARPSGSASSSAARRGPGVRVGARGHADATCHAASHAVATLADPRTAGRCRLTLLAGGGEMPP